MSRRSSEPGWEPVAVPDGRRGVWRKVSTGKALELCGGREGDDVYLRLQVGQVLTSGVLEELSDVLDVLPFSTELAEGREQSGPGEVEPT